MHPNDLKEFRDNVAMPRMMQLFENTQIPEGACYIDNLEFGFLDGRSCGVDSHILASGLVYRDGRAEKYVYDEYDVDLNTFFVAHKDCIFVSGGRLRVEDELDEIDMSTRIRNIGTCQKAFSWFDVLPNINIRMVSDEYEKLKYLLENQPQTSLDEQIGVAKARASEPEEIKFVLTARSMFSDNISQRTSFSDEAYCSLEEAQDKCREFQRDLASHMIAGIEKVKFSPGAVPIKTGSYWELHRGEFEMKSDEINEKSSLKNMVSNFER